MSELFFKRLSNIFGLFTLLALFCLLVFAANLEVKDLDLWLHLGMGKYIVHNGFHVPTEDILSCSITGKPWVNHEWLFQVIVYLVHRLGGFDGLITMQVTLVSLTMMILLFLGYNREKQLASIFILLLVSLVYQDRFTIRPDLYSLLFFALYIFLLSFYIDKRWSVYALFVIQVLWTNIHGFFFFGPLFVLIGLLAEWMKRNVRLPYEWNRMGRLNDQEYRRLKVIFLVVILACLINPLALKGAWYPISVFFQISGESRIFFDKIIELKKPITTWDNLFSFSENPYYKLLIILSFVSFIFNRRKIDIGVLIFWLVFLLFSLMAIRNLIYFAFAAYLVFVTNALSITLKDLVPIRIVDKKFIFLTSTVVKFLVTFWIIQYALEMSLNGYYDFDKYERKSEFGGVSLRNYPHKAVDFLVENKIKGNFFNDFNSGAYLVGRCFPDIKVFIDGRTEVYGPKFFKDYQELWEKDNVDQFTKTLNQYNLTGALMNTVLQPVPKNALNYLFKDKQWVCVYFDYDGLVFLQDIPEHKEIIDRFRIDLTQWKAKTLDLYRVGSSHVTPYQHSNRAYTLESLDLDEGAMKEAQEALRINPSYLESYKILGKIYAKRKDFKQAFENFRIATMFSPHDQKLRLNLALAYYDLGEFKYAIEQYQKIIDRWAHDPKAYFLIARAYLKNKQLDRAMEFLHKAHQLDPKDLEDLLAMAELFIKENELVKAKEVFELSLKTEKDKDKVYLKLGRVYQQLGDKIKAKEFFEEGLKINANQEEIKASLQELGVGSPLP